MPRPNRDQYYLEMIKLVAARSTCIRRAVGAIIVDKDGHILSTGYNGVPPKMNHCTDIPCLGANDSPGNSQRCLSTHSEISAIIQCHRLDLAYTLYVSCSPCFQCAKAILLTPIVRVVTSEKYSDLTGLNLLETQGISVNCFGDI